MGIPVRLGSVLARRLSAQMALLALLLLVCGACWVRGADSDVAGSSEQTPSATDSSVNAAAPPSRASADSNLSDHDRALKARLKRAAEGPPPPPPPPPPPMNQGVVVMVIFLVLAALAFPTAFRIYERRRKARLQARLRKLAKERQPFECLHEEEPTLRAFFEALQAGPAAWHHLHGEGEVVSQNTAGGITVAADSEAGAEQSFFRSAPDQVAKLRGLFADASRSKDPAARQKLLLLLAVMLGPFKESCAMPRLRSLWQLASALEAFVKQLAHKESDVTESALKTVAGALDMIEVLSAEGAKQPITADSPVRLLAVDDDAVSLRALSFALKKAFKAPDVASDGKTGLARAAEHAYDVIFLDVEMPGMDGFELCTQIRRTALNRATPVVFVTSHSDFDSRAKSALCGGNDLIGKPFLALEITVKALTLVVRSRQHWAAAAPEAAGAHPGLAARIPEPASPPEIAKEVAASVSSPASPPLPEIQAAATFELGTAEGPPNANTEPEAEPEAPVFRTGGGFGFGAMHFEAMASQMQAARQTEDVNLRQELLGELFVSIHELTLGAARDGLKSAARLSSVLEDLLKKLIDRPALVTPFVLDAAADALDLLEELCLSHADPEMGQTSSRILVVDDDPIARRTLGGFLQLGFRRPEIAESGEAALELAREQAFDLIFMDVLMPGMDGFTACVKIHETEANRRTPILFVTNYNDEGSRQQAAAAGGCGFITKPVMPKEIMLRTLTLTLRRRFDYAKRTGALANLAC